MKPFVKQIILVPLFLLAAAQGKGQSRSLTYQWLNEPCAEVISCEGGCTACNMAEGTDAAFIGTNAAWIGLDVCPMPFAVGDNAVFAEGWSALPNDGKGLILSLIALTPTALDTIALRHRAWSDGPERLRVSMRSGNGDWMEIHDGPVAPDWEKLTITGLGCLQAEAGMAYGYAQLMVQAYGGGAGAWVIDELRVAGTPCEPDHIMGVQAIAAPQQRADGSWFDALGRSIGSAPAAGAYQSSGRRRVVVY